MTAAMIQQDNGDTKSATSYKSTPSTRSSVLERARDTRERAMASVEKEKENRLGPTTPVSAATQQTQPSRAASKQSTRRSLQSRRSSQQQEQQNNGEPQEAVVSPELLVDALSGHEDGLLAIAERLMEHYDAGYDVMGESIIDAFADVQKLFQHVVEAAHMEGAAFEASRREEEIRELKKQAGGASLVLEEESMPPSPSGGPVRHDEFIDQDVKDCLTEAIRNGAVLKEQGNHLGCYELYEAACQSASSLLPVDSDHRGRLQLSIARAESMHPDRACAILRYAMDDVLRSGLRAGKVPLSDPSKRADVVLSKPKAHPSMNGSTGQPGVVQSSEEALASLVEEMKEIIAAPIYKDTPLQQVAKRFWAALADTQKQHFRNEERLEQNLAKLKGDYLLARAEWEEKLTHSQEQVDQYKKRYANLKDGPVLLDDARNLSQRMSAEEDVHSTLPNLARASSRRAVGVESVASLGSSMAHHARSLVGSFNCGSGGINERTGGKLASELAERREEATRQRYGENEWRDRRRSSSAPRSANNGQYENNQARMVDV